jgi:hypothetical protein
MSEDNPTLKDLFVPSKLERRMPGLEQALIKNSTIIKWDAVQDVLADKVLEMLDVPLLGVLLSAWKKYREVKNIAGPEGRSATEKVSLAQHTLKSEHHPYLEIRLKGVPVETLHFTVVVELVLEGFILTIQDRKITPVETGRMKGQGSLALETSVILEKEFSSIGLPGTMTFGEGIPLSRA